VIYPFGKLYVYHYGHKTRYALPDAQAAQIYFDEISADRVDRHPPDDDGNGVGVMKGLMRKLSGREWKRGTHLTRVGTALAPPHVAENTQRPVVRRSAAVPSHPGYVISHSALVEVARRETATYLPLAAIAARHPGLSFERDR
jgi:hypothetical protein